MRRGRRQREKSPSSPASVSMRTERVGGRQKSETLNLSSGKDKTNHSVPISYSYSYLSYLTLVWTRRKKISVTFYEKSCVSVYQMVHFSSVIFLGELLGLLRCDLTIFSKRYFLLWVFVLLTICTARLWSLNYQFKYSNRLVYFLGFISAKFLQGFSLSFFESGIFFPGKVEESTRYFFTSLLGGRVE